MMCRRSLILGLMTFALATGAIPARAETPKTPKEILDFLDDLYRADSSHGKMSMKVVTANWSRELTLEQWTKGKKLSLVRILAPQKEKGSATLRADLDVWNFLPKVDRVVKISSSMMSGSWMGSHYTNDDLVKQSRFADDFTYVVSFQGKRDGHEIVELTMTPKPDAAVVWGKIVASCRTADIMPVKVDYFDEDLKLARTMSFSDYKKIGGRLIPAVNRMTPMDKPGEYTEMHYQEFDFNVPIEDSFFSLRNLQK